MKKTTKEVIVPLVIAVIGAIAFCYAHIMLWGDNIASYTNYNISIFVWPAAVSAIIGLLCSLPSYFVNRNAKSVLVVVLVPVVLSLIFSTMVYLVLAYAPH